MSVKRISFWRMLAATALLINLFSTGTFTTNPVRAEDPCMSPVNEIVAENCQTGNPPSEWEVAGAGDASIQGFATDISVNQGQMIDFKIDTASTDYRIDIYRLGYYGGLGARKVATIDTLNTTETVQPACQLIDGTTDDNLVDCGNWTVSVSWAVPSTAVSGIYIARLVRQDVGGDLASHIAFIVRDDDGNSDLLFQASDTTWQAYNRYGGYSLYDGPGHAHKVSYNRPFTTRDAPTEDWLFNAEYPMIRWLERNGYDVSYFTDVDSDRRGSEILEHKVFLSVGHDEYWSAGQRANVEAARDAGVHLAFFSGNEIYWKTRWEPSTADGGSTDYRTLVSYKEGDAQGSEHYNCLGNFDCDPTNIWTGLWRQNQTGHDGGRPENSLSGNISWGDATTAIQVPAWAGGLRFWRNAGISADTTLTANTLGYEFDWEQAAYASSYPAGRITLSDTTAVGKNHKMSLYRAPSGALVFGAGTVQWSWGLDGTHDRGSSTEDPRMQQATVNLFADMGVQPASLQTGLVPATASTDSTGPTAVIVSPASGANVSSGSTVTISGTASDSGGGVVAAVEISLDNGTTWNSTSGRDTWSYNWIAGAAGASVTILSRAVDDSGNIGAASASVTLNVTERVCPCSIWNDAITPANIGNDGQAIEVGVKFQSSAAGRITGLRFYKGVANTGTHTGHLWASDGTQLAEAVFSGETASGWQEVYFVTPVEILADTTYVASYHSSGGGYSYNGNYFTAAYVSLPLRALADGEEGGNGVYKYGASGFPTTTFQSANYWVDVIFDDTPQVYSIWEQGAITGSPAASDPSAVELGTKFKSDVSGSVTGVAFYKGATNTGPFLGHLWTLSGAQLAEKSYTNSTTEEGWQVITFDTPVSISANTTYVVSYFTQSGNYANAGNYFTTEVYNLPLRALANNDPDGPNGVFYYGAGGGFPTGTYNSGNYWVDVLFTSDVPIDTTPPTVLSVTPANGASGANVNNNITARFSEAMDAATINGTTFELRDAGNNLVAATVSYTAATRTATLDPNTALAYATTYTATVKGGTGGVSDPAGNELAANFVWTFATSAPPPPPPYEGPGGPILVVTSAGNPFGTYFAEILRAEGLNAFAVADITTVDATLLTNYDVVILGEMSLATAQVTDLADWVTAGGNLIAMRPDTQLAGLLGLTNPSGTLANAYLLVNTSSGPGVGIVNQTIQFHGTADLHTLNGATALVMLYSDSTTATTNPAVTMISVGSNGGQAAAFTFDLARSVVYTRQGNPAWQGINGDGGPGPVRADDMFHNGTDPDWVNLDKVAIPQADEQQRLLANLILQMNLDNMPLPRFWYFPRGEKAIVVMTSDDHASSNVPGRLDQYKSLSPVGCSVDDWECVRSSVYIYSGTALTETQANTYTAEGFEIGAHIDTSCNNYTLTGLENFYNTQLAAFATRFPGLSRQDSERTHCIAWSGWAFQPTVKEGQGIRLDTNYYFWPPAWVNNQPGLFTGSGMPMRFADSNGTMFDVYQATTQMTDESGQSYPYTIDTLISRALGTEGYYGVFTANMHSDSLNSTGSDAIVASAQSNGVPVISGRQLLTWLDGRNGSAFGSLNWSTDTLSFTISIGAGANGLQVMLPFQSAVGPLSGITFGGNPVTYTQETIKGINYAIFNAQAGAYIASYAADATPPVLSNINATPAANGTALITWDTNEPSDSLVEYGTVSGSLGLSESNTASVTTHSITLTGLAPSTTYYYRASSTDGSNNTATSPEPPAIPLTFTTPVMPLGDDTAADFNAGTLACSYVSSTSDGELILPPAVGTEFDGTSLPLGWEGAPWAGGGSVVVSGDILTLSYGYARTTDLFVAGRSLEFVATFSNQTTTQNQHAGFGYDLNSGSWAIFSTGGASGGALKARSTGAADTDLGTSYLGSPHLFRIEWYPNHIVYYIDGTQVADHNVSIAGNMRPIASDDLDGAILSVDWMRMSPFTGPCTFTSRVFDAGSVANWQALNWTAGTPAGAGLAFSYRIGNAPTPGDTWTSFIPVPASGAPISGRGRYAQYQVTLNTTDPSVTPNVQDVGFTYNTGSDTTAPTIVARVPAVDATDIAIDTAVTITFSELLDAGTVDGNSIYLRSLGGLTNIPAAVTLAGNVVTLTPTSLLEKGRTYIVTVKATVADPAGNLLGADSTWNFTTVPDSVTDTTIADFSAGATGACVVDATIGDGAVRLPLSIDEEFSGATLPAGWSNNTIPWQPGGTTTVNGGLLAVDGAVARNTTLYGPGSSLEFAATFKAVAFQHVGFGGGAETFNQAPIAMFSTRSSTSTLYTSLFIGGAVYDVAISDSGGLINTPHRYRIDWKATGFDFYVDGVLVSSRTDTISDQMRVGASDYLKTGNALTVDWVRLTPYVSPCAFESRVLDAGFPADWLDLSWVGSAPAGTSVGFETRSGNTSMPGGSWSVWANVNSPIPSPDARYIQYRAMLASSDAALSPVVESVTITYRAAPQPIVEISLNAGWNLVSLPVMPTSTARADVLASIEGNYDLVYAYDGCSGAWQKYDANAAPYVNSLTDLDHTRGFWVKMNAPATLTIQGTAPDSTPLSLCSGWNLTGYPSPTTRPLPDVLNGVPFTLMYAYDAFATGNPWQKYDVNGAPYANTLTSVAPKRGYWIRVSANSIWTVLK